MNIPPICVNNYIVFLGRRSIRCAQTIVFTERLIYTIVLVRACLWSIFRDAIKRVRSVRDILRSTVKPTTLLRAVGFNIEVYKYYTPSILILTALNKVIGFTMGLKMSLTLPTRFIASLKMDHRQARTRTMV